MKIFEKVLFNVFICLLVAIPLNGVDVLIGFNIHVILLAISFLLWIINGAKTKNLAYKYVAVKVVLFLAFLISSFLFEKTNYYGVSMNYIQEIIIILLICQVSNEEEYKQCLQSFVLGALLNSILVLFGSFLGLQVLYWGDLGEERLSILGRDPNEMAMVHCFAIAMALYLLRIKKQKLWMVLNVTTTVLSIASILYTGSRTATIAVVLLILSNFILSSKRITGYITGLLVTGLLMFAVYYIAINFLEDSILERYLTIGTEVEEGTMANRTNLWDDCIRTFEESNIINQLCGHGFDTSRLFTWNKHDAHNVFLKVLVEYGIVGEVILLYIWFFFIKSALRQNERNDMFLTLSLLTMVFVSFLTLSWMYNILIWIILILVHIKIKYFGSANQIQNTKRLK